MEFSGDTCRAKGSETHDSLSEPHDDHFSYPRNTLDFSLGPAKHADAATSSPKENQATSAPKQTGDDASSHKSISHNSHANPVKIPLKLEEETGAGAESDESDIVEHDVKVCDICGDTGREDMLAICSRCSDGAEHTYCMRRMLRKVPGSNWMCEECRFAEEINTQKQGLEAKRLSKSGSGTQFTAKRLAENVEVAPAAKRQALETNIGSPRSSSPVKMVSLSRESSFKNFDKERLRPAQQVSISNRSTNEETAQSPVAGPRLQSHKGSLLKSKSFNATNSKPKVKLVDKVVPQKQKGGKEHASIDGKERSKFMQKSMSFKSANLGRSNASDSKVKMFSPRISPTLDSKGSRSLKERNVFDRKNLSKLDRLPVSSTSNSTVSTPKSGEYSMLSFAGNIRDLKVQSEGKSSASKATGNLTRRPMEVAIASVGVLSVAEQKSKDDASFTTDKPSNSVEGNIPNGLPRSLETSSQLEKTKETSMLPRSTVLSGSRSTFCQKCKEIGHSAEFCTSGGSEASVIDTSAPTARSSREEIRGVSKLKEAIHAALLRKPEIQRKKRTLDQADEISTSSTDLSSEIACHDQAMVSNKSKIILSGEGNHEVQQAILRNSISDSSYIAANTTVQHTVPTTDAKSSITKSVMKDFTSHGLAASSQLVKMLAIPEYEYIWRGCFEVNRSGSVLELCGGIQAHLSTCVSPRVPEVAHKFPQKLSFNEVPRLSVWPTQFYDGGAKEDNIALYFFAKDLESYERHYKSLLDGMIKNDLALKGNFEGVELLIFPSNQLPENSQRWNMLFFLWGVFRARRVHNSDSSNKPNITNDRMVHVDKKAPNDVISMSENLCSPRFIDTESSRCDRSCSKISRDCNDRKISEPVGSGLKASSRLRDSSRNDSKYTSDVILSDKTRCTSPSMREKSPTGSRLVTELKPCLMVGGAKRCEIGDRRQLYCESSMDGKDSSASMEDVGMNSGVVCEKKVMGISGDGENKDEREERVECGDECCRERKRGDIDLSERGPPTAAEEDRGKKRKTTVEGGSYSYSYSWVESKDECLSSVEEKACVEEDCEEKVIPEDLGTTERRFFPVDPRRCMDDWKGLSKEEEGGGGGGVVGFPNLDLALGGAEATKPPQNKGMLPFLVGLGGGDMEEDDRVRDPDNDHDDSASLSLSLSFSMNKEQPPPQPQAPLPVSKPERQRVNTSLLLFGGFRDK